MSFVFLFPQKLILIKTRLRSAPRGAHSTKEIITLTDTKKQRAKSSLAWNAFNLLQKHVRLENDSFGKYTHFFVTFVWKLIFFLKFLVPQSFYWHSSHFVEKIVSDLLKKCNPLPVIFHARYENAKFCSFFAFLSSEAYI